MTLSVEGQVTIDGDPIEGATVIGIDDTNGEFEDAAQTGSDGWYELAMPEDTLAHLKLHYQDPQTGEWIQTQSQPFVPVEDDE